MRDILTVLAGLLILVLTAALAVPPFLDWEARRPLIDAAISRATGVEARTEGPIAVRLLPSPRIRIAGLRLGPADGRSPSLSAGSLIAEIALGPLLSGNVRFTETRIGRAEIWMPTGADGRWRLPDGLAEGGPARDWAFEDLEIGRLLVTSLAPSTGRTDQFYAEGVKIAGRSLAGPWQVEGTSGGTPFRLATGELQPDRTLQAKLVGGGDAAPRFEVDARLDLASEGSEPILQGTAKVLFGPPAQVAAAGLPIPVQVQAGFKSGPDAVALENLVLEAGEGGATLRLNGGGRVSLDDWRIALDLEGRRLDLDGFLISADGRDFLSRAGAWRLPVSSPIALNLKLGSVLLGQEELQDVTFSGELDRGTLRVSRFEAQLPGETRLQVSGALAAGGDATGRIAVKARASDRLARYLGKLGAPRALLAPLDGRPLEASGDVTLALPVASLRNARLALGDATVTGAARYTAPEAGARARIDAQVAIQGLNIDDLPPLGGLATATRDVDVGLILNAANVRHGGRAGAGRVAARIQTEGAALRVETLEITDLAGANASLSGRIEPDGSGRIAGRIEAKRAAPLIDLVGAVWLGDVARLVPSFLREGGLSTAVVLERAPSPPGGEAGPLRTTLQGGAAGGRIDAEVLAGERGARSLSVRLATDNAGVWVDRPDLAILRRAASLELRGVRVPSGLFNVTLAGDVAGVAITTSRPIALAAGDAVVDSGEVEVAAEDATPLLALLGDGAGVEPPVPLKLRVALGRERDATLVTLSGSVAGSAVQGRFAARPRGDIDGALSVERLSLPWLAATFALNTPPDPKATALWSTARFGQSRRLLDGGRATIRAGRLDLGRGLVARDATLAAEILPEGFAVRDLSADLAGGRLTGGLSVTRQGSLAAVVGEGAIRSAFIRDLVGSTPFEGRLTASLKFGASGESVAALVANLAGGGEVRITDFAAPNADPAGIERAIARLLKIDDPLAPGRIQAIVAEELARGPLRSGAVAAPATLVGGVVRLSPLVADAAQGTWQGFASIDLKALGLDARGALATRISPERWTGSPPFVNLGYRGPLANPAREVDAGSLVNGIAAIVLQRELERVEAFEQEGNERQRRNGLLMMNRERRNAEIRAQQEEAARKAREEAARRAQEEAARRAEQEAARRAADEARRRAEQAAAEAARLKEQQAQEEAARQLKLRQKADADRARAVREQLDAAERGSIAQEPASRSDGEPLRIPSELFDPAPVGEPLRLQPGR